MKSGKAMVLVALLAALMLVADDRVFEIPAMNAPKVDGVIDASEWEGTTSGDLPELKSRKTPSQPTKWYAGCDSEHLFCAFRCEEANVDKIRRRFTHSEERDNAIYTDDCIEVFVDTFGNDKEGVFHFAVNTAGIIYDSYNGDSSFQSDIKVACRIDKSFWEMEIQIPFADLGISPKGAEMIRLNLGRERQGISPPEYSCLGDGDGGFTNKKRLCYFRPLPLGKNLPPVSFFAMGSPMIPELRVRKTNPEDKSSYGILIETFDRSSKTISSFQLKTSHGIDTKFDFSDKAKRKIAGYKYSVFADDVKTPVYSNVFTIPAIASEKKQQAMSITNPLFKELLGDEFPPRRDWCGIQWVFGAGNPGNMQGFALQNGMAFSNKDFCKEYASTGMAVYVNVTMVDWVKTKLYGEEFNTPIAAMPRVLEKNMKYPGSHSVIVIPDVRRLWLEDVKTIASSKGVKAITFADEVSESVEARLISDFKKFPDNQEILAFDAKIKQKYGQGKYGIPKDENERDPLAWIAYRRALNDELVSLYHEAYKLAKNINPAIVVISDDPSGHQNSLYAFADWKGAVDIVTHQLYPRHNPNVDSFGFLTRYISTLTEAKEIWPCPHVEEYATSFEPQDVLYKLSSAMRNGATGFHYYLNDTVGRRSGKKYLIHEYFGAPDRYAVEIAAQKYVASMPRIKIPKEYDVAVFTSIDSLRAIPGLILRRSPDKDMYLHGFLGYGAGVNYRFINEACLDNLKNYRFIVTNENTYVSHEAFNALVQYVQNGGILLILGQEPFKFTPEGEDLLPKSEPFMGVKFIGASQNPMSFKYDGINVPVTAIRCSKVELLPGATAVARFANGDPAIVECRHGTGKVLTLSANPCMAKLAGNKEWNEFFLKFSKACGAKTQCDFWRFQLPDSLLPKQETNAGKCLTNNFVKWEHFEPTTPNQSDVTGSYLFSPEPNLSKDVVTGDIPFNKGKLTDRPRAVNGPSVCLGKSRWTDWAVAWNKVEQPICINCRWSSAKNVKSVKLYVSGIWRKASIEIGGEKFDYPCGMDFNDDSLSVRLVEMSLPHSVNANELKITLEQNPETVTISEMEIWSE
ncbi:MAG: hypothetical protein J6X55_16380 [Victivallales bacterium]|nr:hypothetical protein [Victivallales bacterium]